MNIFETKTKNELVDLIGSLEKELSSKKSRVQVLAAKKEATEEDVKAATELANEVKELEGNIEVATKELSRKNEISRINAEKVQNALKSTEKTYEDVKAKSVNFDNKGKAYALEFAKAILDGNVDQLVYQKFGKQGFTKSIGTYNNSQLGLQDFSAIIPTYITEGIERKMADYGGLIAHSQVISEKGRVQIAIEKTATGAEYHDEGTPAIAEEEITLDSKTLIPRMIKKIISWTDEIEFSTPEALLTYLIGEFAEKILQRVEYEMINGQLDANNKGYNGIVTEANVVNSPYVKKISAVAVDWRTAMAAMGEVRGNNPKWFMNRSTYYAQVAAQADTTNQPIYGTNVNGEPTFNGVPVVFTDGLKSFDDAVAGNAVMFLAVQNAVKTNMPNGVVPNYYIDNNSFEMKKQDKSGLVGAIYGCSTPAKIQGIVVITKDVQPI